jgi:hypothetical protein
VSGKGHWSNGTMLSWIWCESAIWLRFSSHITARKLAEGDIFPVINEEILDCSKFINHDFIVDSAIFHHSFFQTTFLIFKAFRTVCGNKKIHGNY